MLLHAVIWSLYTFPSAANILFSLSKQKVTPSSGMVRIIRSGESEVLWPYFNVFFHIFNLAHLPSCCRSFHNPAASMEVWQNRWEPRLIHFRSFALTYHSSSDFHLCDSPVKVAFLNDLVKDPDACRCSDDPDDCQPLKHILQDCAGMIHIWWMICKYDVCSSLTFHCSLFVYQAYRYLIPRCIGRIQVWFTIVNDLKWYLRLPIFHFLYLRILSCAQLGGPKQDVAICAAHEMDIQDELSLERTGKLFFFIPLFVLKYACSWCVLMITLANILILSCIIQTQRLHRELHLCLWRPDPQCRSRTWSTRTPGIGWIHRGLVSAKAQYYPPRAIRKWRYLLWKIWPYVQSRSSM